MIEIRDGYMALRPADVPGVEDAVHAAAGRQRLSAADEATVAAATRLELARRAELRGETPAGTGGPAGTKAPAARPSGTGGSRRRTRTRQRAR